MAALRRWLQARFREHDHFSNVQIFAGNVDQPNVGGITATRSSDAIRDRGFTSLPGGFKIILAGPHYTAIKGSVAAGPNDHCSS